jgi:hypothetical protein
MMRHALGVQDLGGRWSKPYRNHYVAGDDDVLAWEELVARGHARKTREASDLTGGFPTYAVTDEGKRHALEGITVKTRYGYGEPKNQ